MEENKVKYSTRELSELLNVKMPTLYKWEKDFNLTVPRHKNGERFYIEKDKLIFEKIKTLRDKKFSIQNIKEYLIKDLDSMDQEETAQNNMPIQYLNGEEIKELLISNMQGAMKEIACTFQEELKRTKEELRQEVRDEIRKEFEREQNQRETENQKLIDYILKTREEDKKKGFWARLFVK